jgi:copper chaperone NosL
MRDPVAGFVLLLLVATGVACPQSPTTGPGEIKWDRQTCERCQMVISERRFAAQTRKTGERRTYAFDDVGCALLWLDQQGVVDLDSSQEVWVHDAAGEHWVDGHSAHFDEGHHTPMGYGFAVTHQGISLEAVHETVRETERRRRSEQRGEPEIEKGRDG